MNVVTGNLFAFIIVNYYDPTGILAKIGRVNARLSDYGVEIKMLESEGSAYSLPPGPVCRCWETY
jgi:hypothetical protein